MGSGTKMEGYLKIKKDLLTEIKRLQQELKIKTKELKRIDKELAVHLKEKLTQILDVDQSDEAIQLLLKSSSDFITIYDENARILYFRSPKNIKLDDSFYLGKKPTEIYPEELGKNLEEQIKAVSRTGKPLIVENKIFLKGTEVYLYDEINPIRNSKGKIIYIGKISRDITEIKRIQKELEKEKEKYRVFFSVGQDLKMVHGFDANRLPGKFIETNDYASIKLGYSKQELLSLGPLDIIKEFKKSRAINIIEMLFERGFALFESNLRTKDGKVFPAEINSQLFNSEGKTLCFSLIRDITERKLAETRLAESELRYRSIFDYAPIGIIEFDISEAVTFYENLKEKGILNITQYINENLEEIKKLAKNIRLLEVNNTALKILNIKSKENFIKILSYSADFEEAIAFIKNFFNEVIEKKKAIEFEFKQPSSKGDIFIALRGELIPESEMGIYRCIVTLLDITEKKKFEQEILKAQKLESLGILAGGIAHDFNNTLTAIIGNISLAKMNLEENNPILEDLKNAENAALQARNLTQQMLTFSTGGSPIKSITSLKELIMEIAKFCLRGSNAICKDDIQDDLWNVNVDKGQISQVINNLIINAIQAMPKGGVVGIKASNEEIKQFETGKVQKMVKITIEDNGIGIPKKILPNIFDPFFTTKKTGTGLGLTICYSIVKSHGGYITVESEEGKGSKFYVFLPAIEEKESKPTIKENFDVNGSGIVFVLDDEPNILSLLKRILKQLGYEPYLFNTGEDLIKSYKEFMEKGESIKFLILDLTIPGGMGGKETLEELKKINPQVKAFVSSGYSNDPIMGEFQNHGFMGVIAKPYTIQDLKKIIDSVLL